MHTVRLLMAVVLCLFNCFAMQVHAAEKRLALVIGNAAYDVAPLHNPENDATDVAELLDSLGFEVTLKKNVGLKELEDSVRQFGHSLKNSEVGLFYYAGHGMQVAGKSYLIPVGATIRQSTDLKYHAVDLEMILDELAFARNKLNIVILDACRDNPLGREWRSGSRGLAAVSTAPSGMLISYSTSPNMVAADGSGRNSPYTSALLRYMQEPGLIAEQVFKKVRHQLEIETKGQQTPWELSSLKGDFYFVPADQRVPPLAVANNGRNQLPIQSAGQDIYIKPRPAPAAPSLQLSGNIGSGSVADHRVPVGGGARPVAAATSEPNSTLHVIGVYEGSYPAGVRHGYNYHPDGRINVVIRAQSSPITLVLASYEPVEWRLSLEQSVQVKEIVVSGYHPSKVVGASEKVKITRQALGYAYDKRDSNTFFQRIKAYTGHSKVESFQGAYSGQEFSVN